jgi:hypothetical protein
MKNKRTNEKKKSIFLKAARLQIHSYFHENFENVSECLIL